MFGKEYTTVEDFLLDDTFAEWAAGEKKHDSFWIHYMEEFPGKIELIQQALEIILAFKVKSVNSPSVKDINDMVEHVKRRVFAEQYIIPQKRQSWYKSYRPSLAAVVFIFLLSVSYFFAVRYSDRNKVQQTTVNGYSTIINNSPKKIIAKLSDHSSVILSPLARLKYPVEFSGDKREVWLSGEAFFEVTKDVKHPFFVYSDELNIRVVGTSFFVKANQEDKTYQVTVSTGKVAVSARNTRKGVSSAANMMLNPNQAAVFHRQDSRLEKTALKDPSLLSDESAQRHLRFESAPFSQVVEALEHAYGINIIYNEKEMNGCLLTASLTGYQLDERLNLICKAIEADYMFKDGNIIISGKGCN